MLMPKSRGRRRYPARGISRLYQPPPVLEMDLGRIIIIGAMERRIPPKSDSRPLLSVIASNAPIGAPRRKFIQSLSTSVHPGSVPHCHVSGRAGDREKCGSGVSP